MLVGATILATFGTSLIMVHPEYNTGYSISKSLSYEEKILLTRTSYQKDYERLEVF